MMYELRFPVGEFEKPEVITDEHLRSWIADIESFPSKVVELTGDLSREQKNWKYRPDGWMIKQVVHHCVDSHINAIIRFKLALTEDRPTIRPYFEDRWANLVDDLDDDLSDSVMLLTALHRKWVKLLRSITPTELKREFIHPEYGTIVSIDENIGIYAWHCRHHLAHVQQALDSGGKYN